MRCVNLTAGGEWQATSKTLTLHWPFQGYMPGMFLLASALQVYLLLNIQIRAICSSML